MTFWSILRQRCWGLVLVVAGVCVITFIISHLIGDPARLLAGDRASIIVENIRQQLGLDQPLYVRFTAVSDLFHGDWNIHSYRASVLERVAYIFPGDAGAGFAPSCWHS